MNKIKFLHGALIVSCASLLLPACGSGGSDDDSGDDSLTPDNVAMIDATAGGVGAPASDPANKYTYFDLDTGSVVDLTDAEAETDTVWDIAFKRSKTKINGGASGPGNVSAALADAQDDFYDVVGDPDLNVFLNASADSELPAFDSFTDATGLIFASDENGPRIDGSLVGPDSWALYSGPPAHSISAQADAWNIVRSANGSAYAKIHVTNIVQASRDITVEMFIQQNGETVFDAVATTWTAAIGAAGGQRCFDFETEAEVDCTTESANWDLMVEVSAGGFEWNIWTNGGIQGSGTDGASYGTIQTADFTYTGVGDDPGEFPDRYLEADAPSGVFVENSWYAYNLQGAHKLWPNYRVFAIDVDGVIYKLQFLSYYGLAGEPSGTIVIRFESL